MYDRKMYLKTRKNNPKKRIHEKCVQCNKSLPRFSDRNSKKFCSDKCAKDYQKNYKKIWEKINREKVLAYKIKYYNKHKNDNKET